MDDPNKDKQDSLDQARKAQASKDGTPPEVYSKAQVDEMIQKDRIDRGRDAATLQREREAVDADKAKLAEDQARQDAWQTQQDAAALEVAKGDPDKMQAYTAQQTLKQERSGLQSQGAKLREQQGDLDRRDADLKVKEEAQAQKAFDDIVFEVSAATGVHPEAIRKKAQELKLTTAEQIKAIASGLKDGSAFEPDTAITRGAGKDLSSLSADEKLQRGFSEVNKKK